MVLDSDPSGSVVKEKGEGMDLSELVAGPVVSVSDKAELGDVAKTMEAEGVGSVAVVDHNEDFVGIITDRDIVRAMAEGDDASTPAGRAMTASPDTIDIDTEVADAVSWLNATGYRHLPVTDNGNLVGMVSIKDLLWAITSG
jgi:CBS domain-containing protein